MRRLLIMVLLLSGLALADDSVEINVVEEGMGPGIAEGQEAVISYRLTLENGTLVEATDPIKPYRFVIGSDKVIPGMSQGVSGMKLGERRELRIPPSLAYGQKETGPIPANSTLLFEIQLLEIQKTSAAPEENEEAELSDQMRSDDFLAKRNARDISKPAIFEYLIRDFFTKPWRYSDGHIKLWKQTLKLGLVFLALLIGYGIGRKRGYFIP
ncbi:MAG: FKBP-type peptidyl-prolyl cis-trans isomerase [Candidatus Eremiobacteraeota bacterium]|nr:FKBP-type peptidyl-prolyl cis-trans isomerase [Candidatus Eremiobacteraeota bacterium]